MNDIVTPAEALRLASFGPGFNVAVVGASGGIGSAFTRHLANTRDVGRVFALARTAPTAAPPEARTLYLDLEDESSIAAAAAAIAADVDALHLIIVASGMLHEGPGGRAAGLEPEKSWRALDLDGLTRAFRINAAGPALVAKHFLPLLARDRKGTFAALSARVGSIEDNQLGGWYGYRGAKAALNMYLRSLAIELARKNRHGICVGLHPGTVDTALSKPFQSRVPEGRLFSPDDATRRLLSVLDGLTPVDSGRVFAYDGSAIPF